MSGRTPPSAQWIVWRDFMASILVRAVVAMPLFWLALFAVGLFAGGQAGAIGRYGAPQIGLGAVAVVGVGLPMLALRIRQIRRVIAHGVAVQATVSHAARTQAQERLFVRYTLGGVEHERRNVVKHDARRPLPEAGTTVTVYALLDAPARGFVAELYDEPSMSAGA